MKTAGRENPNRWGPQRPATELMPRQVRTDLVRSSGLRSKKNSSRKGRCFFLTSAFIERLNRHAGTAKHRGSRTRHIKLWVGLWVEDLRKTDRTLPCLILPQFRVRHFARRAVLASIAIDDECLHALSQSDWN